MFRMSSKRNMRPRGLLERLQGDEENYGSPMRRLAILNGHLQKWIGARAAEYIVNAWFYLISEQHIAKGILRMKKFNNSFIKIGE
jgi:hypothetical protein